MNQNLLLAKLEKGFRFLSGLALALILFQGLGVLVYILNAWPRMIVVPSIGITVMGIMAIAAGLTRSSLWIQIYWNGARILAILRTIGESAELPDKLVPILKRLTRLLVASCILDFILLPGIFLMDVFFPFTLSSVQLGLVQLAVLLIPQAFGLTAVFLAYLTHHYGQLVEERCRMKEDLALTV